MHGHEEDNVDTDELIRSRLEIAFEVFVWSFQNDFPETDEVPASIARNAGELLILKSLSPSEILLTAAIFYAAMVDQLAARGGSDEAIAHANRMWRHADAASRWFAWRHRDRYGRDRPDRRQLRRTRPRERRAPARQRARAPTGDDDSPSPNDIASGEAA
jgi:hypothetical protein